jgi:hypothetical protein
MTFQALLLASAGNASLRHWMLTGRAGFHSRLGTVHSEITKILIPHLLRLFIECCHQMSLNRKAMTFTGVFSQLFIFKYDRYDRFKPLNLFRRNNCCCRRFASYSIQLIVDFYLFGVDYISL